MKKRILIISILLIILCVTFIACDKPKTNLETLHDYISTYQTALYTGGDDLLNVNIIDINQEEIFLADGLIGKIENSVKICLKPKDVNLLNMAFSYKINGDTGSLSGEFDKDKLGVSFSQELNGLNEIGALNSVTINYEENSIEYPLTNVLKDSIDYSKALEIAYNNYLDKIDPMLKEKSFDREIYIKVVSDKNLNSNDYYWYVAFIKSREDYFSTLVSLDGNVITSRIMTKD